MDIAQGRACARAARGFLISAAAVLAMALAPFAAATASQPLPQLTSLEACWNPPSGPTECVQSGSIVASSGRYEVRWLPTPADGGFDFVEVEIENVLPPPPSVPAMGAVWHRSVTGVLKVEHFAQSRTKYRARACRNGDEGFECGAFLAGSVEVEVPTSVTQQIQRVPPDPQFHSSLPGIGGPGQFPPGVYQSSITKYNGWYLQWANNLGREYADPGFGTFSELHLLWVTYFDMNGSDSSNPDWVPNMQPTWLWAALNRADETGGPVGGIVRYSGLLMKSSIVDEQRVDQMAGYVIVRLNGPGLAPTVTWYMNDLRFYDPDYQAPDHQPGQIRWVWDHLRWSPSALGLPENSWNGVSAVHHWQGWWRPQNVSYPANDFELLVFSSGTWENASIAFFDGLGQPIWATMNRVSDWPSIQGTEFCVYTVTGTHWPDVPHPGHEYTVHWLTFPPHSETYQGQDGLCERNEAPWNFERRFGPDLPLGNNPQEGLIEQLSINLPDIGRGTDSDRELYGSNQTIAKWKSNHAIRYIANGREDPPVCYAEQHSNGNYYCNLEVSWYSDGKYPQAELVVQSHLGNNVWTHPTLVGTWPNPDTGPYYVFNQPLAFWLPNSVTSRRYRFSLRRPHSPQIENPGQVTIAKSHEFDVLRPQDDVQAWITSPSINSIPQIQMGEPLNVVAAAASPDASISTVQFYAELEGQSPPVQFGAIDGSGPYQVVWLPNAPGRYELFVRAFVDSAGISSCATLDECGPRVVVNVSNASGTLELEGNPCHLPHPPTDQQCTVTALVSAVAGTPESCLWLEPSETSAAELVTCSTEPEWSATVTAAPNMRFLELKAREPGPPPNYDSSPLMDRKTVYGVPAPAPYDAYLVAKDVPRMIGQGQTGNATFQFWNIGSNDWSTADQIRLVAISPNAGTIWGSVPVNLPHDVSPCNIDAAEICQSVTFSVDLVAPLSTGEYPIEWQLQRGAVPFGQSTGIDWIIVSYGDPDEVLDQSVTELDDELPPHDPTIGTVAGEGGVAGGAATYSIPIVVPPGRRGMQPEVSLDYNSRAGNGIAGMGWSLSGTSSIHRCPRTVAQDGQIRAVQLEAGDRLCLDGQRLMLTSGAYGQANAVYRTEIDSFARVTQLGTLDATDGSFRVETRSGDILLFGGTGAVLVPQRADPTPPLTWFLARREDRLGNFMQYQYTTLAGEVLLNQISYTGFDDTLGDRRVDFLYEPRTGTDRSSSYIAGGAVRQTQRLRNIITAAPYNAGSPEWVRVYELIYEHSAYTDRSLLKSLKECAHDGNVESCRPETEFEWQESEPQHRFEFNEGLNALGAAGQIDIGNFDTSIRYRAVADFSGDGHREVLWRGPYPDGSGGWSVKSFLISLSPNGQLRWKVELPAQSLGVIGDRQLDFMGAADFHLDGRASIIGVDDEGAGPRFTIWSWNPQNVNWAAPTFDQLFSAKFVSDIPIGSLHEELEYVGDVNGDGRADLGIRVPIAQSETCKGIKGVTAEAWALQFYRNSLDSNGQLRLDLFGADLCFPTESQGPSQPPLTTNLVRISDVDGDGLPDFWIRPTTGTEFRDTVIHYTDRNAQGAISWSRQVDLASLNLDDPSSAQQYESAFWMDVNGDGLEDMVYAVPHGNEGHWAVRLNTGLSFSDEIDTGSNDGLENCGNPDGCSLSFQPMHAGAIRVMDFDADGRANLMIARQFAARVCTLHRREESPDCPPPPNPPDPNPPVLPQGGEAWDTCQDFWACPEQPETGAMPVANGVHMAYSTTFDGEYQTQVLNHPEIIKPIHMNGQSAWDRSFYVMHALRFVEQSNPNGPAITVEVVPTDIVMNAQSRGGADDMFGNGLTDLATSLSCFGPLTTGATCAVQVANAQFDELEGFEGLNLPDEVAPNQPPSSALSRLPFLNTNLGAGQNPDGSPETPELLALVRDGLGRETVWTYHTLSSDAGREAGEPALYAVPEDTAERYIDESHIYFTSSMPVVSSMVMSDGIGGFRDYRYAYREAMYNKHGRGFQGFRTIIEDNIADGLRTTTQFHQRFPLTSQAERVVVTVLDENDPADIPWSRRLRDENFVWRCRLDNGNIVSQEACVDGSATSPISFTVLDTKRACQFDAAQAEAGGIEGNESAQCDWTASSSGFEVLVEPLGASSGLLTVVDEFHRQSNAAPGSCSTSMGSTSSYDAWGNLKDRTVITYERDHTGSPRFLGHHCERTESQFDDNVSQFLWWINKLQSRTVSSAIAYHGDHALPLQAAAPPRSLTTEYIWNSNRTLKEEQLQDAVPGQSVLTLYDEYSAYGLPEVIRVQADGDVDENAIPQDRLTTITYSGDGYFPHITTNAEGHAMESIVRPRDGQLAFQIDANQLPTEHFYDPFGQRVQSTFRGRFGQGYRARDQHVSMHACSAALSPGSPPSHCAYAVTQVQEGAPTQVSWFDQFGRVLREEQTLPGGERSRVVRQFNARGLLIAESQPFAATLAQPPANLLTTYQNFDVLGRVGAKTQPAGEVLNASDQLVVAERTTEYTYLGRTTQIDVSASAGDVVPLTMWRYQDALGRFARTVDAKSGTTRYWYDPAGQPVALSDANFSVTRAFYNDLGQRTAVFDPNQGDWTFEYNALGELTRQIDARQQETTHVYDRLGRRERRVQQSDAHGGAAGTVVDTYHFDALDALGLPAGWEREVNMQGEASYTERTVEHSYDTMARLVATDIEQHDTATTHVYRLRYAYDGNFGRLKARDFNGLELVQYLYDGHGHLITERDPLNERRYRQLDSVNPRGQPTAETIGFDSNGFGMPRQRSYDPATGQLREIVHLPFGSTTPPPLALRELDYAYDAYGNLRRQRIKLGGIESQREAFSYDELHRLTLSTRTSANAVDYLYDAVGNIRKKNDYSTDDDNAYTYGGGVNGGGPNAVTSVLVPHNGGAAQRTYGYDANGNMISGHLLGNHDFQAEYDAMNLPVRLRRGLDVTQFRYGADDQRTRQLDVAGNTTRIYVENMEHLPQTGTLKITIGDHTLITRQGASREVHHLLRDRLGSVDGVVAQSGAVVELRGYDAFGGPRNGDWDDLTPPQLESSDITPRGFTDHEHLDSVEIIHMNGRAYDYRLGRFLSVDPFIQAPLNSQSLNPYSYIMNSPLAGTDPTGYISTDCNLTGACSLLGGRKFWWNARVDQYRGWGNLEGNGRMFSAKARFEEARYRASVAFVMINGASLGQSPLGTVGGGGPFAGTDGSAILGGSVRPSILFQLGANSGGVCDEVCQEKATYREQQSPVRRAQELGRDGAEIAEVVVEEGYKQYSGWKILAGLGKLFSFGRRTAVADDVGGAIAPQIAKIEKQLAQHGRSSVEKSQRSLERRLAQHREALETYRAQGGYTSSVEREIRAFEAELQAIREVLGRVP